MQLAARSFPLDFEPTPDAVPFSRRIHVITYPGSLLEQFLERSTASDIARYALTPASPATLPGGVLADAAAIQVDAGLVRNLARRGIAVVVLARTASDAERLRWLEAGADDCAPPTWTPRTVVERLRTMLARRSGEIANRSGWSYVFADWAYNPIQGVLLSPSGRRHTLGRACAQVLMRLLLNPHRHQTLDDLRDCPDNNLSLNNTRVTVFRLRSLLATETDAELISTRPGHGYRFCCPVHVDPTPLPFPDAEFQDEAIAFGEALLQARISRQLSQLDLALEAGISARHLSFLENGRSRPTRAMVIKLATGLSATREELDALLEAAGLPTAA